MAKPDTTELPATPLFAGVRPDELPELLTHATRVEYPAGQPVFTHGEEADAFYVVVSGAVEVRSPNGNQPLAHLAAGAVLGETSLLLGGRHSASVIAVEPTTLLRFSNQAFLELLEAHHPAASRILFNIARTLAVRLRSANELIHEVAQTSAGSAVIKNDLDRLRNIFFSEWAG